MAKSGSARAKARMRAPRLLRVSDESPGICRRKAGKGYSYRYPDGTRVTDPAVRKRIQALAIPPAWRDVWICPEETGYLQATGRDARNRKQYLYHPAWSAWRSYRKFGRLIEMGRALPRIRQRVRQDMSRPGMDHDKMTATAIRMLELSCMRVGSREYARRNHSYGLTTLRRRHVRISGSTVRLHFRGKQGIEHDILIDDRRVVAVLRRCLAVAGYELLRYRDTDGAIKGITAEDVNAYLRQTGRADITARHFRTWMASVWAFSALQQALRSAPPTNGQLKRVIEASARRLRNTPAICRQSYIHPAVIDAYQSGNMPAFRRYRNPSGLLADERRFFHFLVSLSLSDAVSTQPG